MHVLMPLSDLPSEGYVCVHVEEHADVHIVYRMYTSMYSLSSFGYTVSAMLCSDVGMDL